MLSARRMTIVVAVGIFLPLFLGALAEGAEEQRDPRNIRNMVLDARDLPAQLTEENQVWQVDIKAKFVYGQPIITDDYVLVGMDSRALADRERFPKHRADLACFDRETGELVWNLPWAPRGPWWAGHGYTSTPWVDGERVYTLMPDGMAACLDINGMADGNDGPFTDEATYMQVESLLPNEGDILWLYDFSRDLHVKAHDAHSSDPLIVGDLMIFGTGHAAGVKPAPAWYKGKDEEWTYQHRPNLVAVDKNTGEFVAQDKVDIPRIYHGQWSSPSVIKQEGETVIVWGDGYGLLHGFGLPENGEFPHLWQMDLNPEEFRTRDGEELPYPRHHGPREAKEFGPGHVIAKPVYHDGRIYIGTGRDHYYTSHPGGRIATPGVFLCIDASDPTDISRDHIIWEKRIVVTQSTASVKDGLVYLSDGTGVIRCLDADTGETYWEHDMGGDVTCRSQVVADGKVYIGTDRKMFYVFEESRTKNILFEAELDGRTSTVGAVDGLLMVATERSIRAYKPRN